MPLLQIKSLTHFFGGLRAVYDCNLDLEEGELVGLIGPNGAGKTTIFNLVTGAYKPTEGEVWLNGHNVIGLRPHQITAKGIARTFQTIRLWNELTVLDNICIAHASRIKYSLLDSILHGSRYREEEKEIKEQAMELLAVFGLAGQAQELAKNMPYGAQRRVEIARALATEPRLLLLERFDQHRNRDVGTESESQAQRRHSDDHPAIRLLLDEIGIHSTSTSTSRLGS
ncbi:MAG TPA: ABC transporter ATP-binding protein [Anaerolineae bacterium]|nr:ABC transporter ATP-binding protein [Anaerolineae bacterium]